MTLTLAASGHARDFTCDPPAWQSACNPSGTPSITTTLPGGQSGTVSPGPTPPGIPVTAPYPIGDWWFSQIFKYAPAQDPNGAPVHLPSGAVVNPLPFNIKPWAYGVELVQPYPEARDNTDACATDPPQKGQPVIPCPGFQAEQPPVFKPEVTVGLADTGGGSFAYPADPLVRVNGFSTWSNTFEMYDASNGQNDKTIVTTAARGSPFVWVEYPLTTASGSHPVPTAQFVDASDQIFGQPTSSPYQVWTNASNFATSVNDKTGSTQGAATLPNVAVASVNGRAYAIIGPDNSYWRWQNFQDENVVHDTVLFYNEGLGATDKRFVIVAALPANVDALIAANQWTRLDAVQFMLAHAHYRPSNETSRTATRLTCAYNTGGGDGNVTGTFAFETLVDIRTGQAAPPTQDTLFCLFPHQKAHLASTGVLDAVGRAATYSSVKGYARPGIEPRGGFTQLPPPEDAGQMYLGKGRSFQIAYTLPAVPPVIPPASAFTGDLAKLNLYLDNDFSKYGLPLGIDTYNWGKHMARAANNVLIANEFNHASASCWKDNLCSALSGWFTANAPGGGLKPIPSSVQEGPGLFWYDQTWGTMIGFPAGFGSNAFLNDHHFHYGYFLRAAGVLASVDPAWRDTYKDFVNLLARDLAADYNDSQTVGGVPTSFAAFNYFDPYAGHGNAAGGQQYSAGINQESSSEAVNAWYGLLLWATEIQDTNMAARAAFMYCSETDTARRYWFQENSQVDGTNPVTHGTLANVYDTICQYAGFSRGHKYLHIINWLPFGGGAEYLAANKPYAEINYQRLVTDYGFDGTNWGVPYADLIWMYRAITNPTEAQQQFAAVIGDGNGNEFDCDSGNTLAMTYLWIHTPHGDVGDPKEVFGDLDHDGDVDGADLGILLGAWGPCPRRGACEADFDSSGVVDGADLGAILGAWTS
ncbi:MAG: hypothetical protein JNM94_02370 [Phycisphaerae bacterium]|nr:hypothetical protein [Phycisphaerae bacterium]